MPAELILNGLGLANPFVGQGVYALRIVQGLQRVGRPFRVLAPASFAPLRALLRAEEFEAIPEFVPHSHELVSHPWRMQQVCRQARRRAGAVFHSPSPFWSCGRLPERRVVTLHDCIYRHFPRYLGRFVVRRLLVEATERWAARADIVLTDSHFSARDLVERASLPKDRIEVVYPWVDQASFEPPGPDAIPELRKRYGLPERFWLYLGGYDYRKNLGVLLEAHTALTKSHPNVPPLVLAGRLPGPETSPVYCDIAGLLRRAAPDSVLCPGLIAHADLPNLYRAADLLVYPSLMEGFGLPPAEAMAVGTPVLVGNNSSLPEVVQKPDCRFDAENVAGLTDLLRAATTDPRAFLCPLPEEFTEAKGLARYLEIVDRVSES
ncbi:MAG: glycosyltransferase family 4 protein [Verrucomicrobia bacterium]|nr:glycosyltransferase family 4 protein [Verrucomicrobiota bacterium]